MTIQNTLEEKIAAWRLLKHPFYQAWECGELPAETLAVYAREYGAFVNALPHGWAAVNDAETVEEEEEHAELWAAFAGALGTEVGGPAVPEVQALLATADELFAHPVTALGALYAFEAQQPETAASKLDGLRKHYSGLGPASEPYFEVHSHNQHESEKLAARIAALTPAEQTEAAEACERMSQALWDALTGIHQTGGVH